MQYEWNYMFYLPEKMGQALSMLMITLTMFTNAFLVLLLVLSLVYAQEEFFDAVTCYECTGKAVNSTCGDPFIIEDGVVPNITKCKKGACIKWTYYKNGELMIHRTCSAKINMHIQLDEVCRSERDGNGFLCMCPDDHCNGAGTMTSKLTWLVALLTAVALRCHRHIMIT